MGISIFEMGIFICLHILLVAGRKSAAAPIFCIKLEIKATVPEIRPMILISLLPASLMIWCAKTFITPVLSRPAPIIMMAIIETTALELRPLIAWEASMTPERGRSIIIRSPTMSTRTISNINKHMTKIKKPKTMIMSEVNSRGMVMISSVSGL